MKNIVLLFFTALPLITTSQKCFPGRPAENLAQITQATAKLPPDIDYTLASYDFKPLKLVDSLVDKIPDFASMLTSSNASEVRELQRNFYATFSFTCITYVYEFRHGYLSAVEAGGEIEARINTQFGTLDCLSYKPGHGTTSVSRIYVVKYTSIIRKQPSKVDIDYLPFIFCGYNAGDKKSCYWYFIGAKSQAPSTVLNTSLTALIFDNDKVDGDSVRIGKKLYALTKDTISISFNDSLLVYVISTGKIADCTFRVVIKETREVADYTGQYGQVVCVLSLDNIEDFFIKRALFFPGARVFITKKRAFQPAFLFCYFRYFLERHLSAIFTRLSDFSSSASKCSKSTTSPFFCNSWSSAAFAFAFSTASSESSATCSAKSASTATCVAASDGSGFSVGLISMNPPTTAIGMYSPAFMATMSPDLRLAIKEM